MSAADDLTALLDTGEVAAVLRCTRDAVTKLVKRGSGPAVYGRGARGALLFRAADVAAWMADPIAARTEVVRDLCECFRGREVVYLVRDPSGYVKIGKATRANSRVAELQIGNPRELVLVATLPGDHVIEGELQGLFVQLRVRGEWFRDEPTIEATFRSIEATAGPGDGDL